MILAFPPVETANEHGLLAVGGDLEPESLVLAYSNGIFPWPLTEDDELLWFSPPKRAILKLNEFRLSRSMERVFIKTPFQFEINKSFEDVISGCQAIKNRPRQQGTWITEEMKFAYIELHRKGYAHSFECYLKNELVGGVYGVSIGKTFAAESMFYRYPNASKAVLWILGQYLLKQEVDCLDCQIMNPHLSSLGAIEIPRADFISRHKTAISRPPVEFTADRLQNLLSSLEILQRPKSKSQE